MILFKTFYITDASDHSNASTPARACNACYEAVFPILPEPSENDGTLKASMSAHAVLNALHTPNVPPSMSMPSLALDIPPLTTPMLTSTSSSFSSRIRNAPFFRKKKDIQKLDHASPPERPSTIRAHSALSSASSFSLDPTSASTMSDEGSQYLSSIGGSSGIGIPASIPDSPTITVLTSRLTFPTIGQNKPQASLAGRASMSPLIAESELPDAEDENDTVHPRRGHQRPSRASAQAVVFDRDTTPRATARKPNSWSIGVHPTSLPIPDFSGRQTVSGEELDAVPDLPADDALRAVSVTHQPSDNQPDHQKRPERRFKKRISIAPFPSPTPLALSVHDTPVTARTRPHGHGKSRRFSLMLGGTIRGLAQGLPTSPSRNGNPRGTGISGAPRGSGEGTNDVGAWTIEGAAQAAPSDVELVPPSNRSYSLQHGVTISKLAELLGRDRVSKER